MSITILGTDHRYEDHARTIEDHIRRYEPDQVFREGFRDMDPGEISAEYDAYLDTAEDARDAIDTIPEAYDDVNDPDALCPAEPDEVHDGRVYDLHPAVLEENGVLEEVAERKRSPASTESYRVVSAAEDAGAEMYGCDMDLPGLFSEGDHEKVLQRLMDPRFNRRREDRMVERIDAAYDGGDALVVLGETHVDNVAADLERAGHTVTTQMLDADHRVRIDQQAYIDHVLEKICEAG